MFEFLKSTTDKQVDKHTQICISLEDIVTELKLRNSKKVIYKVSKLHVPKYFRFSWAILIFDTAISLIVNTMVKI